MTCAEQSRLVHQVETHGCRCMAPPSRRLQRGMTRFMAQVASFGDFFAEKHGQVKSSTNAETGLPGATSGKHDASAPRKRHGAAAAAEGPVEALTYRDPFAGVYKKYSYICTQAFTSGVSLTFSKQIHLQRRRKIPPWGHDGWRHV